MNPLKVGRVILNAPFSVVARILNRRVRDDAPYLLGLLAFAHGALLHAATSPVVGLQQSFTGTNVKATLFIPGEMVPRFGFVPLRVSIDNRESRDLRWQARFVQSSFSNSGLATTSQTTTTLLAPAGRSADRWIFVPTSDTGPVRNNGAYYGAWGNFALNIDGNGISETNLNFNSGGRGGTTMAPWAVSASLDGVVRAHLSSLKTDAPLSRPGMRGRPAPATGPRPLLTGAPNLFAFDPAQSLGDWRIWSPFARVILPAEEFATLAPANRAALLGWVALGGVLYVAPSSATTGGAEHIGAGLVIRLRDPIAPDERHDSEGLFSNGSIFGLTLAIPQDLPLPKDGLLSKISPAKRAGDWLVYFFVGFAVLVAPVNLFAIAPARRRHWLFLTVPAISLVAVGVLVTAIYLQDGVGGEGARRALVVLLPGEHQAAVFQEQVSRTGLLFGTSFPLADDTICAAVEVEDSSNLPGRVLDFARNEGRASGDWFRGRARQAQHLRRLTPTRARVEQVGTAPDGAPIVQSSVGATLRDFSYLDAAGVPWGVKVLPAGTRVTLRRLENSEAFTDHAATFALVTSAHLTNLAQAAFAAPTQAAAGRTAARAWRGSPGRFLALADDSDLAPLPTLASIRWQDSAVLMTGLVENAGVAGGKVTP